MMVEGRTKEELVSVTNYEYGLNNWLEKEIKKQGKTTETYHYRYDDNGNETFRIWEKTAPTPDYPGNVKLSGNYQKEFPTVYEWRHYNGFNQLIRINQDDKEITYQYRGDDLRHCTQVRKLTESQGKTNLYCWDGTDIVAEQNDNETLRTYLRGINLIACEKDRVVYYYILNEHGDIAQLWNPGGGCNTSYEYDAFGVERNPDKEDNNPFRYCGEYLDLETNIYYIRARYYRAATGRFLTEDSVEKTVQKMPNKQKITDPLSLNKYTYCHNNPVLYSDPTGHNPFLVVTAIAGFFAGAIAGAISSAIEGKFSLNAVVKGAAVGATVGMTGGAALAYGATGGALTATGEVASGLGFGVATVDSAGSAGFAQARQLLQAQEMRAAEGVKHPGLGKISGNTYEVTQDGLTTVKNHLSQFDDDAPNNEMIQRLENALQNGQSVTGADASFYLHELKEAELMANGLPQQVAHSGALDFYQVSKFSVYHPDVIQNNSRWFNNSWFDFWRID